MVFSDRANGGLSRGRVASNAMARSVSGMVWSRPAFIRPAGMVHSFASRSNSAHVAPVTSPVRAAVRIVNSSAARLMLLPVRSVDMNAGRSA